MSSTVTVANNNKQEQNSDEGSGKRPDLGILIRGLPVRSSGMYNVVFLVKKVLVLFFTINFEPKLWSVESSFQTLV